MITYRRRSANSRNFVTLSCRANLITSKIDHKFVIFLIIYVVFRFLMSKFCFILTSSNRALNLQQIQRHFCGKNSEIQSPVWQRSNIYENQVPILGKMAQSKDIVKDIIQIFQLFPISSTKLKIFLTQRSRKFIFAKMFTLIEQF